MIQRAGIFSLVMLLLLMAAPALFAQPVPDSSAYNALTNTFTIWFDSPVRTTNAAFIAAGIEVDDDNGGPLPNVVLEGGTVVNEGDTGNELRFKPTFDGVLGQYTFDNQTRRVWGHNYDAAEAIETELSHDNLSLIFPAGAVVAVDGGLSEMETVDLTYNDVPEGQLINLVEARYDANTNILRFEFDATMQFDQLPEDIASRDENNFPAPGNGVLDVALSEDRNGNGVLDMETNVVIPNISLSDGSETVSFTAANDETRQDSTVLELGMLRTIQQQIEALDLANLTVSFGTYTFVDQDYNPAVAIENFPVTVVEDADPLEAMDAQYDMGENELTVTFDQALDPNVGSYAVIPKFLVTTGDDTLGLESGTPALTNGNMSLIISLGLGTAMVVEDMIDANPEADFSVIIGQNAVITPQANGNVYGTVPLEILPEDDRDKAPELSADEDPYYDAATNELYVPFDIRLDGAIEASGFHFIAGGDTLSLTGGVVDRAGGNRAVSIILNQADQYFVESAEDKDSIILVIMPYSVLQSGSVNGNRRIVVDPIAYLEDPYPPLVNYVWYDELNERLVIGSNIILPASNIDLSQLTLNDHTFGQPEEVIVDEPNRISFYLSDADAAAMADIPFDSRTDLSINFEAGFLASGNGVFNEAVTGLSDQDTTFNENDFAVLTLGYGREFFVRSYEAFPTVARQVAASIRRVSEGAYWYVANDQWEPYDPFSRRDEQEVPHPIVNALRPAELDAAVDFFENQAQKVDTGAREAILDIFAGDQADKVPGAAEADDKVTILFADIFDEYGLGRNDSQSSFWKHGYFLPSDLPGSGDEFSNQDEMIVIDSYPQSFLPGDLAYTWDDNDIEWDLADTADVSTAGYAALSNVYTQFASYMVDEFDEQWLRLGLAYLSEFLVVEQPSFYGGGEASGLAGNNSLTFIGSDLSSRSDLKHTYMLFLYLWEKYGGNDIIRTIATSPRTGISSINAALDEMEGELEPWQVDKDMLDIFLDFATANLADTSYSADDNNRYMFENLDTQGPIVGNSLKWSESRPPPYNASCPPWGFVYYSTSYISADPLALLEPQEDNLLVFAGSDSDDLLLRKLNTEANTISSNMADYPFMIQEMELSETQNRATIPMSPGGDWVFGPDDDPEATFPSWVLIAAGGGDFIISHEDGPATFSRLFVSQNPVVKAKVDMYVISELPIYREDSEPTPVVVVTADPEGSEVLTVFDTPDDYMQTTVENDMGRVEQYIAHVLVPEEGEMYWWLNGYYANGVPVGDQEPSVVVYSIIPGGERSTVTMKDGFRMMTGMRTFVKDREMMVIRTPALTDLSDGNIMIDRQPVSDTYTMGTADTKVMDPIAITIPYNEDAVDGRDLGIYLLRNGQWDYVGGEANSTDGTITARVGQLGTYRVMAGGHGEVAPELAVPDDFALGQNYPNPFNPSTTFQVALPHTGRVTLAVYDILGREVARVHDGLLTYGMHTFQWNGRSATGTPLSSGVYFLNMEAEGFNATRKMMLVK